MDRLHAAASDRIETFGPSQTVPPWEIPASNSKIVACGKSTGRPQRDSSILRRIWHGVVQVKRQSRHAVHKTEYHYLYGIKEVILSYGESALFLNMLGKDGAAPLEWVRILFEEERWPYKEGWRPPKIVDQSMMRHVITKLMEANEDKAEEAVLVGLGTVRALEAAVASLIKVSSPSYCSVM
ncbi:uncharacterized protein PV09_04249 [Verruconis gallopava]|uniref:Heme haloperoxidase family profile domain-containing protein n=1 Tax=Verruconis gallopava TaxID=253628 RepID=A0A0D1YV26_9PEZI|nr:uncharacterized protein PV09_04249 [Verruconis gallopava]KIW04492.1 hypothetical protein PV09_04249 [Verruconis gallopava]